MGYCISPLFWWSYFTPFITYVVVSNIFYFHPENLGNWSNLTNIFQMGLKPPTSNWWLWAQLVGERGEPPFESCLVARIGTAEEAQKAISELTLGESFRLMVRFRNPAWKLTSWYGKYSIPLFTTGFSTIPTVVIFLAGFRFTINRASSGPFWVMWRAIGNGWGGVRELGPRELTWTTGWGLLSLWS